MCFQELLPDEINLALKPKQDLQEEKEDKEGLQEGNSPQYSGIIKWVILGVQQLVAAAFYNYNSVLEEIGPDISPFSESHYPSSFLSFFRQAFVLIGAVTRISFFGVYCRSPCNDPCTVNRWSIKWIEYFNRAVTSLATNHTSEFPHYCLSTMTSQLMMNLPHCEALPVRNTFTWFIWCPSFNCQMMAPANYVGVLVLSLFQSQPRL